MKRFEIASPAAPAEAESWRVSLRQLALLLVVGCAIVGAIYLIEGSPFAASDGALSSGLDAATLGPGPKVGEPVPEFQLASLDGAPIAIGSYRGRPLLINFWATWCPPCRAEMPDLDEVAREQSATGLAVVTVNLREDAETVRSYQRLIGVHLEALLDSEGTVFRQFRITGLPTTVMVGRDGVVRDIHVGPLTKPSILQRVARIA